MQMTVVAIVDSGLNLNHRDFKKKLWANAKEIPGNDLDDDFNGAVDDVHGFDALASTGLSASLKNGGDPQGHGTHVAGIVTRLSPKSKIMPIRILDEDGNGRMSDALFAWSYALENGAKVINNSFGVVGLPPAEFSFMQEAVRLGREKYDAVFVSASGNQSNNNDVLPGTPANVPGMISVGATTSSGGVASFSNTGKETVHLFAPGDRIVSSDAFTLSGTTLKSGTSQAAPMVAAALANFSSKKKSISVSQLEDKLFDSLKLDKRLIGVSISGSSLSPKFTRRITRLTPKARLYRSSRGDVVTGRRFRDRFIGVLDPSAGVTQKDVVNDLLCKGNSLVDEPDWPFDNIAVFNVNPSVRRSVGTCRGKRSRSDRVFGKIGKRKPSTEAFTQIVETGYFQSVEWDAEVTIASPDFLSMDASLTRSFAQIAAA